MHIDNLTASLFRQSPLDRGINVLNPLEVINPLDASVNLNVGIASTVQIVSDTYFEKLPVPGVTVRGCGFSVHIRPDMTSIDLQIYLFNQYEWYMAITRPPVGSISITPL